MAYKISPHVSDQMHLKYAIKGKVKRAVKRVVFSLLTDEAKLEQDICCPEDIRLHTRTYVDDLRCSRKELRAAVSRAIGIEMEQELGNPWIRVYRIYNSIEKVQDEQNTRES